MCIKQARQRVLARDAQRKRDEMYAREVFEAAIEAAGNVRRTHPVSARGIGGCWRRCQLQV
jgi:hypothetical protein